MKRQMLRPPTRPVLTLGGVIIGSLVTGLSVRWPGRSRGGGGGKERWVRGERVMRWLRSRGGGGGLQTRSGV